MSHSEPHNENDKDAIATVEETAAEAASEQDGATEAAPEQDAAETAPAADAQSEAGVKDAQSEPAAKAASDAAPAKEAPAKDKRVVIEIRDVRKHFDIPMEHPTFMQRLRGEKQRKEVLKGINVTVREGEVFVLLGSSGSGKSTLLRCVNHLETPDSGTIIVNGHTMGQASVNDGNQPTSAKELAEQRSQVSMVFQHFNLFAHKTVLENITMPLRDIRHVDKEEAEKTAITNLEKVGVTEDLFNMYPDRLSGGQKQRVAIARALAMKPYAILFDEPTSALDPELVNEVLQVIRKIADEGTTMMIVTHEMPFARGIADQIIVMDDGRIVEQGDPETVFTHPKSDKMKALLHESHQA